MKSGMQLHQAKFIADRVLSFLRPHCERIEIAGSIRRQKSEVGDIELVAIPKTINDMFGIPLPIESEHALDRVEWSAIGTFKMGKHKYKKIQLYEDIQLDLFIVVPPAQWGTIFLIRTGPADYSHRLVTPKHQGGLMPSNLKESGGAIWKGNTLIETPEEEDVYKLLGYPWLDPKLRLA